jgi:hypothetical protein
MHGGRRGRFPNLWHSRLQLYTLFNMLPGPPVGTPLSVHAPLEPIKGRARMISGTSSQFHEHRSFTSSQAHTHTHTTKFTSSGNTSHSGRRILRSGSMNHSKPLYAFHVHTPLDLAFLGFPQTHPKLELGGCTLPPGWRNAPTVPLPARQFLGCPFMHRLKFGMP